MWWAARLFQRAVSDEARRFIVRIMACLAGGFVLAVAYGGHAAVGGSFAVGVGLRSAHLVSLSVWIGSLATLALLQRRDPRLAELWPTVSRLAAIGLAITGVSGLLLSGRLAMTVTALLSSSYGRQIVLKAGLLVMLACLGGIGAVRVRRGREPSHVPLELGVAGVAVIVAAILASSAPARGEQYLPLRSVNPQIVTQDVGDLTLSASLEPARPGANLVQLRVLDRSRPSPGAVEAVHMRISGADGSTIAERDGLPVNGVVEWPDVEVPRPGTYEVNVDITRSVLPVPAFTASWNVDVLPVPRAARVLSTRSWAPFASLLAILWTLLVAVGYCITRRWRPSRERVLETGAGR
jgi:copper transport protein